MVTTKLMYLLSDERELPYGGLMMQDAAYFIGGREIRIPVPGGYKVFVERQPEVASNVAMPSAPTQQQVPDFEASIQNILSRLDKLEGAMTSTSVQPEAAKEGTTQNENSKRASLRNAF